MSDPLDVLGIGSGFSTVSTPGIATVTLLGGGTVAETKKKKARGTKGAKAHVTGIKVRRFKVEVRLWANRAHGVDHIASCEATLMPVLLSAQEKANALPFVHPTLAAAGIRSAVVIKVGDIRPRDSNGFRLFTFECEEHREPTAAGGAGKHSGGRRGRKRGRAILVTDAEYRETTATVVVAETELMVIQAKASASALLDGAGL